jgi:hypothetical protein
MWIPAHKIQRGENEFLSLILTLEKNHNSYLKLKAWQSVMLSNEPIVISIVLVRLQVTT